MFVFILIISTSREPFAQEFITLWHVDPYVGNDCEISNYTTAVTSQTVVNSN
jgi:phosphoserine phosphatase